MRTLPIIAATLLVGCGPGGLRTTEVEDLRGIRSAEWIEWHREQSGEDPVWHEFVMSSHGGLCKDLQEMTPALSDRFSELEKDLEDAQDQTDTCRQLERFYEDAAEITDPLFRKPLTTLSLTLRDPDDDREDPPPEDAYDQGVDPDDPWFVGALTITEANPYTELADAASDCDPDVNDALQDALRHNLTWYGIDRGDVEALERGDEAYKLILDGELEDDDGDDAGDIEARGVYRHCEVTWSGHFDPYDWGGDIFN